MFSLKDWEKKGCSLTGLLRGLSTLLCISCFEQPLVLVNTNKGELFYYYCYSLVFLVLLSG